MTDFSSSVTVFVLTVGDEENFTDCIAHLDRQTVRVRREIIDHVAPLSDALEEMNRRCRTPYYVQVDEDMLLFPNAIASLYEHITSASPRVAMMSAPLWDCDIGRSIYGVKIYRHEIVRRFPYQETHSSEANQVNRLRAAGYEVTDLPLEDRNACLGEHGRHYTPRSIYLRWKRLFEKRRLDGGHRGRGIPGPDFFLDRLLRDPQPLHLFSFLGVVAGMTGELPADCEIDYRAHCPDFDRLFEAFSRDHPPKQ